MANERLTIRKTYKLYVGGQFTRSESGRVMAAHSRTGELLDNYSRASRKDLRDAIVAARGAFEGWAGKTAYLRSQILYRAAEMLQGREEELVRELGRSLNIPKTKARQEVAIAIERIVYFAGWADKYGQVFSSVNPVATPHFNFTTPEPVGVVAILAPDEPALLGFISLLLPVILSGNTGVVAASEKFPLPALTFAEILATSDLPGGVVNILSGKRADLVSHVASHMDINAVVDGTSIPELRAALQTGTGFNLKRYARREFQGREWSGTKPEEPWCILDTVEFKTAWHPIGV
jgi:acyl-CoA reductase-like NAD-dependent aldehyde dehydrogenase